MSDRRGVGRTLFSALLLGATAAGLYNVYSDNSEVRDKARAAACGTDPRCDVHLTATHRSPISQTFTFSSGPNGATVPISCQRAYVLLGEYACTRQ